MQRAFDKAIVDNTPPPDTLDVALSDWFAVGLSIGPRLSEWAQSQENKGDIRKPFRRENGAISAFLLSDVTFFTANKVQVTTEEALRIGVDCLQRVRLCWRSQKNGEHGETKTYLRNEKTATLCVVRRMFSIIQRYQRLIGFNQPDVPIAVYRNNSTSATHTIVSSDISTKMRELAKSVYDISKTTDLKRWSSHSLRVGACQILYATGFQAFEIKALLRWKSDSFMDYLRDIAWVARKRNDAIATLDSDEVECFL
jgi:hypothetical protein